MNRKTCLGHCVWFIQSLPCCYYIWFLFQTFCTVSIRFQKSFIQRFSASSSLFIFPPWNCVSVIFPPWNCISVISTFALPPFFSADMWAWSNVSWESGVVKERTDGEKQSDQSSVLRSRRKLIRQLIDSLVSSSARLQSTYQWTSTLTTWWCSQSSPIVRFSPWPSPSTRLSKFSRHTHWSHPPGESPLLPKRVNLSATSIRTLTTRFSVFRIWSNMLIFPFFSECLPF